MNPNLFGRRYFPLGNSYCRLLASLSLTMCFAAACRANTGDPIAIRYAADGVFAIETHWNITLTLEAGEAGVDCRVGNGSDSKPAKSLKLSEDDFVIVDRLANESKLTSKRITEKRQAAVRAASRNAVQIRYSSGVTLVTVDGVKIALIKRPAKLTEQHKLMLDRCHVWLTHAGDSNDEWIELAKENGVKRLVFATTSGEVSGAKQVQGNTIAVSAGVQSGDFQVLAVRSKRTELPREYVELFDAKEKACVASQKVFASLSVEQLNFRPSNGTHTPRWNTEHMMGRELLFFSQIYHALDPAIPVIDLNPKQMPPDYQAKHSDWTGQEEARQMQRVSSFTKRFSYLLRDIELDKKAPGSFWTPRKLLKQMDHHYSEHTANVVKKFKLPNWPKE